MDSAANLTRWSLIVRARADGPLTRAERPGADPAVRNVGGRRKEWRGTFLEQLLAAFEVLVFKHGWPKILLPNAALEDLPPKQGGIESITTMGWRVLSKYLGVGVLVSTLVCLGIATASALINGIAWPLPAFSIGLAVMLAVVVPLMLGQAVLDEQWQRARGEGTRRALLRQLAVWLGSTGVVTTIAVVMPISYFLNRDLRLMVAATAGHVVLFILFGVWRLFEVSKRLGDPR